jgi:putative membrane protein
MLDFIKESVAGFPPFIIYFALSAVMLGLFTFIYVHITPYHEIKLIKEGNPAAAASLAGAILGFTLPLAHAVAQAANLIDMLIWGLIALVVQLVCYLIARALIPGLAKDIPDGKVAPGIFLGVISLAAGILNAACMAD